MNLIERFKKIGLFLILFIIFLFSDLIYLIPFKYLNIDYDALSYNQQTLCSIFASSILILILVFIYRKYLKKNGLILKVILINILILE